MEFVTKYWTFTTLERWNFLRSLHSPTYSSWMLRTVSPRDSGTHHHVTPEHITRLPVRISRPDTTGTHPATRGMSGPFRKDLDNSPYFRTPSHTVGYSLYLGTTSDNTICLSFLIPIHMFFMIFYLMLFITISLDLFHLKPPQWPTFTTS